MISSKFTHTTPFRRRGQTEMGYQRHLYSLDGNSVPERTRRRVRKVIKQVGRERFSVISGGHMDMLATVYQEKIETHGTLLMGPANAVGFLSFANKNRTLSILQGQ